jgi:hypothetical protein
MKSISASIVVASGAAIMSAASNAKWNVDGFWWFGILVCLTGIAGWVYCLVAEK